MSVIDGVLGEVTQPIDVSTAETIGFPPLSKEHVPPCGAWPLCDRKGESAFTHVYREGING